MKKHIYTNLALTFLAITICTFNASAQLSNLKNKVKNATNKAVGGNNSSSTTSPQSQDDLYKCKEARETDEGITSPAHTKYVNKIVFSKTEIAKRNEDESSFINSFTSADNIYARIYVDKAIMNYAQDIGICYDSDAKFILRYTFDDGKTILPNDAPSTEKAKGDPETRVKWTTWQLALSPSEADAGSGYPKSELQGFYDRVFYLSEGMHKVKVELVFDIPDDNGNYLYTSKFGKEKVLATGEFNIKVKNSDKIALKKKLGALSKEEKDAEYDKAFQANAANWSSSSSSGKEKVTIKNKGKGTVYIAKYNSETSSSSVQSGEALGSGSSMTIDPSFYPKISVTGTCSGTYVIKGKGGQEIVVCQ